MGVAKLRGDGAPISSFERSDKALYFAKQQGRNQVHDFADLVMQGRLKEETRESDLELF